MKKSLQYITLVLGTALVSGCSTVTFEPGQGGSIIGDEKQTVWFGGDAEEVYARSKDGYYFVEWEDPKAYSDHKENPLTLRNVDESRTVRARFVPAETARTQRVSPSGHQPSKVTGYQAPSRSVTQQQTPAQTPEVLVKQGEPQKLENLRYLTKTMPARITIQVIGERDYSAITRAVEGSIANAGYEVLSDNLHSGQKENPYLSVLLRNSLGQFDKLGNYYVYKGKTELTVKRNVKTASALKTVLARQTISGKGTRKLGKDDAIDSLLDNLGTQSADYMKKVCEREMAGISAVTVTLRKEAIRRVFGKNMGREQKIITDIFNRASKVDGIMSISQVAVDINTVTFEVIYRKKNFPNGVVHDYIDGNINLRTSDPVGEFMQYLFKI